MPNNRHGEFNGRKKCLALRRRVKIETILRDEQRYSINEVQKRQIHYLVIDSILSDIVYINEHLKKGFFLLFSVD